MTQAATPEMFRGQAAEEPKADQKPETKPDPADKVSPELKRLLALSDQIARGQADELGKVPALQAALRRAALIKVLMNALTDEVMEEFLPLVGTSLGFKTDRDTAKEGYSKEEVRRCMVEALLYGARLTDNEMNIIKGKAYLTKEFFQRNLAEDSRVSDLRLDFGVPKREKDAALVQVRATWKCDGAADAIEAHIPTTNRETDSTDLIIGKATRKMLARVFTRVNGSRFFPEGEAENGIEMEYAMHGPAPTAATNGAKSASDKIEEMRAKQAAAKTTTTAPGTAPFPT